jgi:endonuclease/exonuclease/phosphatase family metal-dependent hydrolase
MSRTLTIGTWNIMEGGLLPGAYGLTCADVFRLERILDLLAARADVDIWTLQEVTGWAAKGQRILHHAAQRINATTRIIFPSNRGCDQAILVRERPGLTVVADHHEDAPPWWHCLGRVELNLADHELHVMTVHLAPSSPDQRLLEAQTFGLYRHWPMIAAGDFNAFPADDPLPDSGTIPDLDKVHRKLDQRAASAIAAAGFHDIATHFEDLGNRTATVGHYRPDAFAYRCDRIVTTLPPASFTSYEVVPIHQHPHTVPGQPAISDHCPVIATYDTA